MTGLADMLIEAGEGRLSSKPVPVDGTRFERAGAVFHIFDTRPAPKCVPRHRHRRAARSGAFREEHCSSVRCETRGSHSGSAPSVKAFRLPRPLREFVAVGHAAAYQPADGPTFRTTGRIGRSRVEAASPVLHGRRRILRPTGPLRRGSSRAITLGDLATSCLETSGADTAAVVIVGEAAALVGAALRQSPAHPARRISSRSQRSDRD
jgi:hypothetical protein